MLILAIDPGTTNIGYCVMRDNNLVAYDCQQINDDSNKQELYLKAVAIIEKIVTKYKPDVLIIESFFGRGFTSKIIGAICYYAETFNLPWIEVSPNHVKKNLIGKGNANKNQIINAINQKFNLNIKNSHTADAIAVALAYNKGNPHENLCTTVQ